MSAWLAAGGLLAAFLYYSGRVEPRRFGVRRVELRLPRWPAALDGLTILHIADLHTRRAGPAEAFVSSLASALPEPDLVVFTGDFAEGARGIAPCLAAIAPLRARLGKFAVLGNNDLHSAAWRETLVQGLAAQSVRVLENEQVRVVDGETGCGLAGLRYVNLLRQPKGYRAPTDWVARGAEPLVLLTHSPDLAPEAAAAGADLILAGHTHGGQLCLPGGRALHINLSRFSPPHFTRGVYAQDGATVFICAGLGMTWPPLRAWCPPEVALLTLRPA